MSTSNGHDNGHATDEAVDLLYSYWPGQQPAPQPLPEARASCNVRLVVDGREVLWTLRDHDEGRLAARLERLLAQYPMPQPTPSQPMVEAPIKDWCGTHKVRMFLNQKDGRTWYSHRTPEGAFCKGK
jgi:hypothetical protein